MAHEITESDGLVLAGKRAWHNLGIVVEEAPSPKEALELAGMDWQVIQTDNIQGMAKITCDVDQPLIVGDKWRLNYRSDNKEILGCVSSSYNPIQNKDVATFADELSGYQTGVKVESAGTVFGGKKTWFLLQADSFNVGLKDDEVIPYILLANGHDGSLGFSARLTSVRVVCNNTLAWALKGGGSSVFNLKHSSNILNRIDEARDRLAAAMSRVNEFSESCEYLHKKEMNRDQIQEFFLQMYTKFVNPIPSEAKTLEDQKKRDQAMYGVFEMCQNFDKEVEVAGATAWNAFNSTSQWLQNKTRSSPNVRAYNNLLGNTSEKSRSAFLHSLKTVESL